VVKINGPDKINQMIDANHRQPTGSRAWISDALGLGIICLLILLFLGRSLLPGRVLLPLDIVTREWPPWQQPDTPADAHNPLLEDAVNYIFPVKQFAAETIREGVLPLWNPYVLTGYPFTYNSQAGIFYPLSLLYYLLPDTAAVDAVIIIQMALGALFMMLYLRELKLRRPAVLIGTALFLFNGLMVVWLEWQVVHAAIIWLPLQLYFIERLAHHIAAGDRAGAVRSAVFTAIALAIPWLGGHWNWTLYTGMTAVIYLAVRLYALTGQEKGEAGRFGSWRPILFIFLLVVGSGVVLSLVQVLPALVYLAQSHRQDLPFSESLHFGLLNRAVVLFVPRFFGDPVSRNWWGVDNFNETTLYLGILPWLLAAAAFKLRRHSLYTRFWLLWGGLGLLWTLGTPLYGLLYVLPVFGGLLPSRAAVLVVAAVSVLAAIGLDALLNLRGSQDDPANEDSHPVQDRLLTRISTNFWLFSSWGRLVIAAVVVIVLVVAGYTFYYRGDVARFWEFLRPQFLLFLLWLLGSCGLLLAYRRGLLPPRWLGVLAFMWITADLFVFGYNYNTISTVENLYPPTETGQFLQSDPALFRLVTPAAGVAFPPNTTLPLRQSNLSGYEPGILQRLVNYVNLAEGEDAVRFERKLQPLNAIGSPLLDALNVKYLVTIDDRWGDSTAAVETPSIANHQPLPVEQPFTVSDAGFHRLDANLEGAGTVTARILSADGGYEFAHTEAGGEGWTSFYFSSFPSEWGREFRLRLEGEGQVGMTADGEVAVVPYHLTRPNLVHESGKTRVYLQENYLPRMYTVSQAVVVPDETAALAALQENAAELDRLVILEPTGQSQPPPLDSLPAEPAVITVQAYALNQIRLTAEMDAPGYLVLADSYYPGWQARIDGRATTIYRANSVVRAVYVPAGQHDITFVFRPLDFYLGAAVSGLAWLLSLAVLLWSFRRRRQR
jgi:hypothetical protein